MPTTLPTSDAFWLKALDQGAIWVILLILLVILVPLLVWAVKWTLTRFFDDEKGLLTLFVRRQIEFTENIETSVDKLYRAASRQAASSKATDKSMISLQETMRGIFGFLNAQHVAKEEWMLILCNALDVIAEKQGCDISEHLGRIRNQIEDARKARTTIQHSESVLPP